VWTGALSVAVSLWLLSTVAFAWPSERFPTFAGAFLAPLAFAAGLAVFAFALVALRRPRDWRVVLAALLGFASVAPFEVSFLLAAGCAGH
jgi:hypothetical protein